MDRFLLKLVIDFPSHEEETAIVRRTTELQSGNQFPLDEVSVRLDENAVLGLQCMAALIRADERVLDYAVRIVRATRGWPGLSGGSGPRSAIARVRAAVPRHCCRRGTSSRPTM